MSLKVKWCRKAAKQGGANAQQLLREMGKIW